jgi:hypothetical protein
MKALLPVSERVLLAGAAGAMRRRFLRQGMGNVVIFPEA